MNSRLSRVLAGVLLAMLVAAVPAGAQVLVSAAVSLTDVLTEVASRYEAATGERVLLNFGASNTLARQIASGARVDVFVSADEAQMDRTSADVLAATRVDLLSNRLAVVVPRGSSGVRTPRDLASGSVTRIAIGDPDAVPAGVYARQYLQKLGLWTQLSSKLVPTGSVRLALSAVETGVADAALVYATDVNSARGVVTAFVVPEAEGPRIRYPAAAIKRGPNPAGARRFLAFLQEAQATAIFTTAGFGIARRSGARE
jgi:molybdate transport system substrate-binding protein